MYQISLETTHQYADAVFDYVSGSGFESTSEHSFDLPGLSLTGRFADSGYLEYCRDNLIPTLACQGDEAKTISVTVLDEKSRPDMPCVRWGISDFSIKNLADQLAAHALFGCYDVDHQIWQFYGDHDGVGVQVMSAPDSYPPWEPTFPLRHFIHWAYQATNKGLIHAGTLGKNGVGILLAGAGGAGKSGTTLAGLLSGLDSVGDDYVVAQIGENKISTFPLLRTMKQDGNGLERLGLNKQDVLFDGPNWQNKYVFDFERLGRGRRAAQLDMKAILLPQIAHSATTTIEKASGKEAMLALAPSSLYQLIGGWHETMKFTGQICRSLPAYKLMLGNDPKEVAAVITRFIESTGE